MQTATLQQLIVATKSFYSFDFSDCIVDECHHRGWNVLNVQCFLVYKGEAGVSMLSLNSDSMIDIVKFTVDLSLSQWEILPGSQLQVSVIYTVADDQKCEDHRK